MEEIINLINKMSTYLLLGFLLAGVMHAFVPSRLYRKYLGGSSFRSVINAAILGVPLPLCSCGVIPTAMSLKKEGASKGAAVSFLIATPQTGVDSIIATYSLMGLPFALLRPIAALCTAAMSVEKIAHAHTDGTSWLNWTCTIVMCLLLINAMILRFRHKGHAHSTESQIRRYKIEGLRCNRCKENAEKAIAAIDGVGSATIDLASGTAEVKGSFDEDSN